MKQESWIRISHDYYLGYHEMFKTGFSFWQRKIWVKKDGDGRKIFTARR